MSILQPRASRAPRGFAFGAATALVAQVATVVGSALTSIVIARMFGPSGTGTVALLGNLIAAVTLVAALGLPTGVTYLVSRREWQADSAFRQTLVVSAVLGAGGGTVTILAYLLTRQSVFAGVDLAVVVIVAAAVPFSLAGAFIAAVAIARSFYGQFAGVQTFRAVVSVAATVVGGVLGSVSGAIVGMVLAQVVSVLASAMVLRRRLAADVAPQHPQRLPATFHELRRASRFGIKAWGADVIQFVNYRLDLFLVGAFATKSAVGHYSVAVSLTMLAWLVPSALQQVLLPKAANQHAAAQAGELAASEADALVARAIRHSVLLQAPTALGLAVLLLVGVPLAYGPAFHQTIALGFLLLPGVLILSVGKVVGAVVTGRGNPIFALYTGLVTVPVTVALYYVLIPPLGATGAAIGSTVSYTLSTAMGVLFLRRSVSVELATLLVPIRQDVMDYWELLRRVWARRAGSAKRTRGSDR